jgi:orotate phosphoribosyltransferase
MKQEIANGLLSIQAVFLRPDQPFTWASGIKSPIYCDNRLTLTAPEVRTLVEESLVKNIKEYFPTCEVVMGTSTAGIAHAAIVGHLMNIPMGYVRGSTKDHGRTNQIEGKLIPGQKVVVIEDLISTAGSSVDTVNILREAGADVLGIASIFTYNMKKASDRLKENKVKNVSLCDLDALLNIAVDKNYIKQDDKSKILKFRDNPQDESWMKGEK